MDLLDISILIMAVLIAVLSARLACWACIRLFDFNRDHWVVKAWRWTPFVAAIVFFIRPVYTCQPYADVIMSIFLDVAVYLPTCIVFTTLVLGTFAKIKASSPAHGRINGKPDA